MATVLGDEMAFFNSLNSHESREVQEWFKELDKAFNVLTLTPKSTNIDLMEHLQEQMTNTSSKWRPHLRGLKGFAFKGIFHFLLLSFCKTLQGVRKETTKRIFIYVKHFRAVSVLPAEDCGQSVLSLEQQKVSWGASWCWVHTSRGLSCLAARGVFLVLWLISGCCTSSKCKKLGTQEMFDSYSYTKTSQF